MSKNIQIPESVLTDVVKLVYALQDYELDENTNLIVERLEAAVKAKIEAMERRNTFSAYKSTKQGTLEREMHRKKYLEQANISEGWKSDKEIERS